MNSRVIQLNNAKRLSIMLICLSLIFSVYFLVFGGQKASAASPEVITTADELHDIRHDMEGDYILGNDIDLDVAPYNTGAGWIPIGDRGWDGNGDGVFTGTFDGKGHKITGLMIDQSTGRAGLFGFAQGAVSFSNVELVDVNVNAKTGVGGLVSYVESNSNGLIENVHVTGTVSGNESVGGVAAKLSNAKIKDSSFDGNVIGGNGSGAGGLVSSAGGAGGIIENSTSAGTVTSARTNVGGLAGSASFVINSSSSANVSSSRNADNIYVGGLVGSLTPHAGEITDSFATGNVEATNGGDIGGLVGFANPNTIAPITNTYATGTVTGRNNVGGLVGNNQGVTITDSYANGEVFGGNAVGGLVGHIHHNNGVIQKSYSKSNVIATGDNVGGLVGSTKDAPKIVDAYAQGNVSGNNNVGGLVGFNPAATIHRSYATGKVMGQNNLGGLIGNDVYGKYSPQAPNYYDKQTTTMTDAVGGTGDTTANMQTRSTFNGWNFTSTWKLNSSDYPILRDQPFGDLTDVASSHWGRDDITEIVETGIMKGNPDYNTPGKFIFKPSDQITRAEFAIVIVNALGETATGTSTGFGDHSSIPPWALKEVAKAKELGIVEGDDFGNFNPSNKISRTEIAAMIARAYQLSAPPGNLPNFVDKASIPAWAKDEVEAVVANGVMQGRDQAGDLYFAPRASAKRVEAGISALRAYKLD